VSCRLAYHKHGIFGLACGFGRVRIMCDGNGWIFHLGPRVTGAHCSGEGSKKKPVYPQSYEL
jgi:hypothetical protein